MCYPRGVINKHGNSVKTDKRVRKHHLNLTVLSVLSLGQLFAALRKSEGILLDINNGKTRKVVFSGIINNDSFAKMVQ